MTGCSRLPKPRRYEHGIDVAALQLSRDHGSRGSRDRGTRQAIQLETRDVRRVVVPDVERADTEAGCIESVDVVPRTRIVSVDEQPSLSAVCRLTCCFERRIPFRSVIDLRRVRAVVRTGEGVRDAARHAQAGGDNGRRVRDQLDAAAPSLAQRPQRRAETGCGGNRYRDEVAEPDELERHEQDDCSGECRDAGEESTAALGVRDGAGRDDQQLQSDTPGARRPDPAIPTSALPKLPTAAPNWPYELARISCWVAFQ